MQHAASCGVPRRAGLELADIVREFGAELRAVHPVSAEQQAVLRDIARCRTASLGGHLEACPSCGFERPAYNSYRNRHCPKCQCLAAEKWIEARELRLLDTQHFHGVFTLPAELRPLARFAPEVVYDALFACASSTLLELGRDPKHLGAELGVTIVLHTWTRELHFHPHAHCIVTGGGLSLDGEHWVNTPSRRFLFHVGAMAKLFRGKMLAALNAAYRRGSFAGFAQFDDPEGFDRFMRTLARQNESWVVYTKPAFRKAEHVLRYLGRYTHRVGIANSRLIRLKGSLVTFRTKGDRTVTIQAVEFLRRFCLHVLPKGFVKIRRYGLLAPSNVSSKLATAHRLLASSHPVLSETVAPSEPTADLLPPPATVARPCPRCGTLMVNRPLPSDVTPAENSPLQARAPP
jgi:predicted RNA-binding Zn-ribbon protein involved in translation (DUF1610 family)